MPNNQWTSLFSIIVLCLISTIGCTEPQPYKVANQQKATSSTHSAISAVNTLATKLYTQIEQRRRTGNLFLSPYSISSVLAMVYAGTKGNTKMQMSEVLGFPKTKNIHEGFGKLAHDLTVSGQGNLQLYIANDIWVQKGRFSLLDEFKHLIHRFYRSEIKVADFQTAAEQERQRINRWIGKKTANRINELLAPRTVTPQTQFILTNAIYFKGLWQTAFDPADTQERPFIRLDNSEVHVPTMYQNAELNYFEDDNIQLIELPYKTSGRTEFSMVILSPREISYFPTLESKLTHYLNLRGNLQKVSVYLPKFSVESTFQLAQHLQKLGMTDAFDLVSADFSGMAKEKGIAISTVIHKAFIEVSEEGTEAAAATAVTTLRSLPTVFRANHPFIFWIKDNQLGTVLFLGNVLDPSA
jgi:serpin B